MTAVPFRTPCQFNAVSGGLGDFVIGAAVAGFDTPQNLNAIDGKSYHYYAQSSDGLEWEQGDGNFVLATTKILRTSVKGSSTGAKISFTLPPIVTVFPSPPSALETPTPIPSGTTTVFYQAAAPVGWTKVTTHNDKSIRIVSGTGGGFGGTNTFSSMFASRSVDAFTLDLSRIPSHFHGHTEYYTNFDGSPGELGIGTAYHAATTFGANTDSRGGGGSHDHTFDLRVQYIDVILASKDAYA